MNAFSDFEASINDFKPKKAPAKKNSKKLVAAIEPVAPVKEKK